ncbi:MAG: high-potential iron-sulfur protein [Bdellovibrionales bacterium]|nr:high-potential iron-sulfur protein [Bdellovibrionales bacterium]
MNKTKTGSEVSRRDFLKSAALAAAVVPAASFLMQACTKKGGGGADIPEGQKALSEKDPVATALGYSEDASKVDVTKFPRKGTAEGAKMSCMNCAQYTALNEGWGKCNIFAQGVVTAGGWCNSWVAKA